MEDRGAWDNALCPRKCGEELEDPKHQILFQWGAMQAAAPGLMATFVHDLHQWREGEPLSTPSNISAKLAEAFLEQTHI
eukprot:7528227-Ditylum_brightwellii.AAC.1